MRLLLLVAAIASLAGWPASEARAGAQLLVTARVVNRCTVELPDRPPWTNPGQGWRKWLDHRCDHPVHPNITIAPVADPPAGSRSAKKEKKTAVNHMVITITY
jgi:hypothetical protein